MAERAKKMSLAIAEDGGFTYTFGEGVEPLAFHPREFAAVALEYLTTLGVKTGARNSTIGQADEGSVGTPAEMRARMAAWIERMKAGVLRLSGGEEKAPASTLLLEAAVIYRQMKAAVLAGIKPDAPNWVSAWQGQPAPDAELLRPEFEALDDFVTNPDAVEKAKAEAAAKGEDVEAAAKKATVTRLDILKANALFKLAYAEAKERREAARKAALAAKVSAEDSPF